uniref:Uncharacterized protein n=1 Tax=Geladintestivirus 2 TaxID=3233134 RepID=A0AAU8MIS1_9CAUD
MSSFCYESCNIRISKRTSSISNSYSIIVTYTKSNIIFNNSIRKTIVIIVNKI